MHGIPVIAICQTYGLCAFCGSDGMHFTIDYRRPLYSVPWKYLKQDGKGNWRIYSAQASELIMAVKLYQAFS